jgi:hypothetical protein
VTGASRAGRERGGEAAEEPDGKESLEQVEASIRLVRHLVKRYPTIEYLIGHHEYRAFE